MQLGSFNLAASSRKAS